MNPPPPEPRSLTPIPYLGKGALLFCVRDSPGLVARSHHHLYHEFDFILDGAGEYAVGGRRFPVQAGDFVYIGRGLQHRRRSDAAHPLVMCNLATEDAIPTATPEERLHWPLWKVWPGASRTVPELASTLRTLLRWMPKEADTGRRLTRRQWRRVECGLTALLHHDRQRVAGISPGLAALALRLRMHPEAPLSLAEEAVRLGLSRPWLSRLFHRLFGITLFEYRDLCRTEKAVKALHAGNETIARLARRLGYSGKAQFINTFKRLAGRTPGAFRKNAEP